MALNAASTGSSRALPAADTPPPSRMTFTPQLVTGVWVGGEERYIHFNSMAFGQGARAALPIYGLYMQKVYADPKLPYRQDARFKFPDDYNACAGELSTYSGGETVEEEAVEGIFE